MLVFFLLGRLWVKSKVSDVDMLDRSACLASSDPGVVVNNTSLSHLTNNWPGLTFTNKLHPKKHQPQVMPWGKLQMQ